MSAPQGMLDGDQFSLPDWVASNAKPQSAPPLSADVLKALAAFQKACEDNNTPMFTVLADGQGMRLFYGLGDNPASVPGEMLMARSTVSGNPKHMMDVVSATIQASGMKF